MEDINLIDKVINLDNEGLFGLSKETIIKYSLELIEELPGVIQLNCSDFIHKKILYDYIVKKYY